MNQKALKTIGLYTFLMLGCGIVGRFIEIQNTTGQPGPGQGLFIVSPLLLAVIFKFIQKTSWQEWALKPNFSGNWQHYLTATLIYPIITLATVGISNLLGFNTFPKGVAAALPLIVSTFAAQLLPMVVKNIFEEFAWRGYLTAQVDKLNWQRWQGYVLIGVIWAAWHIPFITILMRAWTTESVWTILPRFFCYLIPASFIYGELRRRTNSVWVAVWLHAVANAIAVPFILPEIFKTHAANYTIANPSDGWIFIVVNALAAWWIYKKGNKFN
jgi:membrane protease YdiL (CAAX protease family)